MTTSIKEKRKSLKNQFRNSELHLNEFRQIVDRNEVVVGGGGTVVIPSRSKVEGAPTFRSLNVNGNDWNAPEGGGGQGSVVIPSESRKPHAKIVQSLTIDDEPWNVPRFDTHVSLTWDADLVRWVGEVDRDTMHKIRDGQFTEWSFGGQFQIVTSQCYRFNDNAFIVADCFNLEGGEFRTWGVLDIDEQKTMHEVFFISTDYFVEALTEKPKDAPIMKGLNINGVEWAFSETGEGSVVEAHTQVAMGAPVARSIRIDDAVWNFPISEGGGEVVTAKWGEIIGNINEQEDLAAKLSEQDTKINGAVSTANTAKSTADKAKSKADDAKDKANSAYDLAVAAQSSAAGALALAGELEYRVEWTIAPQITALEGSVATLEGQIGTKASIADVDAVNDRVTQLRRDVEDLRRTVNTFDQRITEIWQFIDNQIKQRFAYVESAEPEE